MKTVRLIFVTTAILVLGVQPSDGCWRAIEPSAFASACPIVVSGTIARIDRYAGDHERGHDIAYIAIHRVIKNDLKDEPLQAGGHVQAKMCSSRNRVRVSTDIRYELGTAGIWLLAMANDGSLHIDKHPVQRQPQDRPFVMREVFSVDKHTAMVGRYSRTEWLQHRVSAGKDRADPRR